MGVVKKGEELLKLRIKLLKLADKYSRDVVNRYLSDQLYGNRHDNKHKKSREEINQRRMLGRRKGKAESGGRIYEHV